ncbi:GLPGLI family protein [Vaginella massiliensis]|uniref:GLPGLI family protein n=1 Tax=Vaginella massiliensis TaxID=1816680 RepID=UPI000837C672|nr:GLPGLI family protein [Vaginella massiliensis]
MFKKIIFFLLLSVFGYSQEISGNFKLNPDEIVIEKLDTVSKNIYYSYSFSSDKKNRDKKKNTITVLQIGKGKTKFTDANLLKFDSMTVKNSKKDFIDSNDLNELIAIRKAIKFNKSIVNTKDGKYLFQGKIYNKNYEFIEEIPVLKWDLKENMKEILGYKCKEARVYYKGRNWIAYYSEDIPLNDGPFIFNGLPGLILEVYDDNNEHHFTAQGIDNNSSTIYIHKEKNIIKTTKKDFYKAEQNFHSNPGIYVGQVYSKPGVEETSMTKELPYNPIELNN